MGLGSGKLKLNRKMTYELIKFIVNASLMLIFGVHCLCVLRREELSIIEMTKAQKSRESTSTSERAFTSRSRVM
jgi:hypothetical protein